MKGMDKISRGKGFRGALDYVFNEKKTKKLSLIGGTMVGTTPRKLAKEFGQVRRLRQDIKKPVWHSSLRLPKGETVKDAEWNKIASGYMMRMGFNSDFPYAVVKHDDPEGQHVHIVASRVSARGDVFLGKNENLRSTRHIHALEVRHSLTISKGVESGFNPSKTPTKNEINMYERTGKAPAKLTLQKIIDSTIDLGACSLPDFCERMESQGVSVKLNMAKNTDNVSGISYGLGEVAFKGSQLGKGYSIKGIYERGVDYEQTTEGASARRFDSRRIEKESNFDSQIADRISGENREFNREIPARGEQVPSTVGGDSTTGAIEPEKVDLRNSGSIKSDSADSERASGIDAGKTDGISRQSTGHTEKPTGDQEADQQRKRSRQDHVEQFEPTGQRDSKAHVGESEKELLDGRLGRGWDRHGVSDRVADLALEIATFGKNSGSVKAIIRAEKRATEKRIADLPAWKKQMLFLSLLPLLQLEEMPEPLPLDQLILNNEPPAQMWAFALAEIEKLAVETGIEPEKITTLGEKEIEKLAKDVLKSGGVSYEKADLFLSKPDNKKADSNTKSWADDIEKGQAEASAARQIAGGANPKAILEFLARKIKETSTTDSANSQAQSAPAPKAPQPK